MKAPPLIGWQTLLADLSLILFMVTGAALASSPRGTTASERQRPLTPFTQGPSANSPRSEPVALWRAGGSQSLRRWLAAQQPDARQQLTIAVHYQDGGSAAALAAAQALVRQAGAKGMAARLLIEQTAGAEPAEILATLAYDRPRDEPAPDGVTDMARDLLSKQTDPPVRNAP